MGSGKVQRILASARDRDSDFFTAAGMGGGSGCKKPDGVWIFYKISPLVPCLIKLHDMTVEVIYEVVRASRSLSQRVG